ncbi:peptidase M24 [Pullulanibacillus camelliae]|uniref:Peptidase M24 n=1 Tax=Pullulanibacillus camelliae TaxID=1707096 RepID=A0A8J2VPL7_9BACL|nr:peptidoglycan DD-metalloendopeptidase family protein [Pullulanibacillus camelliae]GGE36445.1 peptidase M24 [Pullulanibacillus camelliae]
MKGRKTYSIVAIGLSGAIALSFGFSSSALAASGNELKDKINHIEEKQKNNKNDLNKTQGQLDQNKDQQEDLSKQIEQVDSEIKTLTTKINSKQKQVDQTHAEIDKLKASIADTLKRIKARDEVLKKRIQTMYLHGGSIDYIEVLLGSKSFGNFINRVVALKTLADHDTDILNEQKADKVKLDQEKAEQNQKLDEVKANLSDLQTLKQQLSDKKAKQKSMMAELEKQGAELEDKVMDKKEQAEVLTAQKQAAEKAYQLWQEEEKKRKEEEAARKAAEKKAQQQSSSSSSASGTPSHYSQQTSSGGSGVIGWPVEGGYVTSGYGWRNLGGSQEFHDGIDIGKGAGTPIHAVADGVIARAYHSTSYGNCVFLTSYVNGKMMTSVYAHMAQYIVSQNQVVHRGDVIGYMGASGEAEGVHLHFELYNGPWQPDDGSTRHPGSVNPLNYLN